MKQILEAFSNKDFRIILLLFLISRAFYFYVFGIYVSPEILQEAGNLSIFSPPLYPLFVKGLLHLGYFPWVIIAVQLLIISLSLAFLAVVVFNSRKLLYVFATLLCVDPNTAHFSVALSPEVLFISVSVLTLAFFHLYLRSPSGGLLACVIISSAISFMAHFQALILPITCLIYLLFFPIHRRYYFRTIFIFILGFQATLIPFRMLHYFEDGTLRLNGLTGYSLWNNSSLLYCNSVLRVSPRTNFETYIAYKPCSDYTQEHSLSSWHISNAGSSLHQYVRRNNLSGSQLSKFSDELFRSAVSIIIQHPVDYYFRFVVPNFRQVFMSDEIREPLHKYKISGADVEIVNPGYMYFNRYFAWVIAALMVFNLLFQAYFHGSLGFLSMLNVGYFVSIGIMDSMKCGDFLLITPFVFLNVVFLWDKLFYRNIYFRFAYRGL
jgi:hypothetical protein